MILLKAFAVKHPESADAWLYLSDASHGLNDATNARRNYNRYLETWSAQHSGAAAPESRNY